jgi:hypothetical protein
MDLWDKAKEKLFKQPSNGKNAEEYRRSIEQKKDRHPLEEYVHKVNERNRQVKEIE